MNWIDHIGLIDILWSGVLVGIVVSAPLGPVGILCIQRTLNKGRWFGFVTGLGAMFSDLIYALITHYGMSFMGGIIEEYGYWLQVLGSCLLFGFGVYTFRSDPLKSVHKPSGVQGSYTQNFFTAFAVTLSNPLIIALFIVLFARFSFVIPGKPLYFQLTGYVGIALGALLWWFILSFLIDKLRTRFQLSGIRTLNKIIGIGVMIGAAVGLYMALTNQAFF